MRKTMLTTLLAVAAMTVFALTGPLASGAPSKARVARASVRVSTRSVAGLGSILVNSKGRTLYMFVPDKDKRVTCFTTCAKIWPPLFLPHGAKAVAAGGAKQSLLGSDPDKGKRVVTYKHWPLYLYLGDTKAGVAYGQGLNANGGLWYVLSPSGAIIKHKPHKGGGGGGGSGTTTTTTGTTTTTTTTTTGPSQCSDADNDGDQSAGGPDDGDGCL